MMGEPQRCVRYLGMMIDMEKGVVIVPEDKRVFLLDCIRLTLQSRRIKVWKLASIKGQLLSMSWAFGPVTRIYTRALGHVNDSLRNWHAHVHLSHEATVELQLWLHCLDRFNSSCTMLNALQSFNTPPGLTRSYA